MKQPPLEFMKIVSTPSLSSWSQAYNAGNIIALLSLTQDVINNNETIELEENLSLSAVGKELLNTLEAEYFTLETKNLISIKQAVTTTVEKVPNQIKVSLSIAVIIENILYLFCHNEGRIILKRKDKLGILLEQKSNLGITSASGYIEHNDIVILETQEFAGLISDKFLLPCLSLDQFPSMAETISTIIHNKQDGALAAIGFLYKEETDKLVTEEDLDKTYDAENFEEILVKKEDLDSNNDFNDDDLNRTDKILEESASKDGIAEKEVEPATKHRSIVHRKKLFVTIAIIVALAFIGSIFFAFNKRTEQKLQVIFVSNVLPAQKKIQEGQALLDLNEQTAQNDFLSAKDSLLKIKDQFKPNSKEGLEITQLLAKADQGITASQVALASTKKLDLQQDDYLVVIGKYTYKAATEDDKNAYVVDDKTVTSVNKSSSKENIIIKNKDDWKDVAGLSTYLGNFYLLDKKAGILKYVPQGNSFSKQDYFAQGVNPDLSKASDIAIDGSIWIISLDGTISKYTKGKQDDFQVKNLDKPFKSPAHIFTSIDANNVYVLDNGNNRIVVLDKNGNYIAQYQSPSLTGVKNFEVLEKDKKIYFSTSTSFYQIDLK